MTFCGIRTMKRGNSTNTAFSFSLNNDDVSEELSKIDGCLLPNALVLISRDNIFQK